MMNAHAAVAGAALAIVLAAAGLPAQTASSGDGTGVDWAASTIHEADLRTHVHALAHDSMRGRDTPSPELMQAAGYVESQFRAVGLQPGAGDAYLQLYPLTRMIPSAAEDQRLSVHGPGGSRDFVYGDEFFARHTGSVAAASGRLVPIATPDELGQAAGDIAFMRVTGSNIRQIFGGALSPAMPPSSRPTGVLVALDVPETYAGRLRQFLTERRVEYGRSESEGIPVVFVSQSALQPALVDDLLSGDPSGAWTADLRAVSHTTEFEAPNVIGWLPGSDPELREEYVLFTAHMDHVGVGRPVEGDSVYNGADDDASGTATIMELAQAFASLPVPPRRSLLFMAVSGEEKGRLGSRWYVEHPTVPLDRIVANINVDMVGRNWRDTVVAIGRPHSTLGQVVDGIAARRPELGMAVIDDPWPEESFYTRSDHYTFALEGVPILFFFSGTHGDYHRPSDEPDTLDYEKMARIGQLLFHLGLEVADADARPEWTPGAFERLVTAPRRPAAR